MNVNYIKYELLSQDFEQMTQMPNYPKENECKIYPQIVWKFIWSF